MKAVNLLPPEARRSVGVRDASPGTLALFAALALALVVMVAYVVLANGVSDRRARLARVSAQTAALQGQAGSLKAYADIVAARKATIEHVRSLADGRYDWAHTISGVARALPGDVTLTDFEGSITGDPTGASGTTAAAGPSVTIKGCTTSHTEAGRVMEHLRGVTGISDVTLQSSVITPKDPAAAAAPATGDSSCGRDDTFALTVFLKVPPAVLAAEGVAAATPATPATTTATTPAAATPSTATPATTPTAGGTP